MNLHLLVVDDEPDIRDLYARFFRKSGFDVTTAGNAREAEEIVASNTIHLAIVDIILGDDDGLELLGRLKKARPALPVVMLTGMGLDDALLQDSLQKGASSYICKDLPLSQVLLEVQRILKLD